MTLKLLPLLFICYFLVVNANIALTPTSNPAQSTSSTTSISYDLNKETFLGDDTPYVIQDNETPAICISWGQNLAKYLTFFIIASIVLLLGFPILWFNERKYIKDGYIILLGQKICAIASPHHVNPDDDEELVHLSGFANSTETLRDPLFGLTVQNALRLKRVVEVYQLKQKKIKNKQYSENGNDSYDIITYEYENVWSEHFINSSYFAEEDKRDANSKVNFIAKSQIFDANMANIGKYMLNKTQISKLKEYESVTIYRVMKKKLEKKNLFKRSN